jgi:hypothetical protein
MKTNSFWRRVLNFILWRRPTISYIRRSRGWPIITLATRAGLTWHEVYELEQGRGTRENMAKARAALWQK